MPRYVRNLVPGGTYFFTLVTHLRAQFLTTEVARDALRASIEEELEVRPFEITAFVLLPDHLHTIWTLPNGDTDYSTRWRRIKDRFTQRYLEHGGAEGALPPSRLFRGERGIWQRRFWEHTISDDNDLKRCLDYIHYNPVKHGLVSRGAEYPWSSFHRWVQAGEYDINWGTGQVADVPGAEWE